jgi:hypothetical protein
VFSKTTANAGSVRTDAVEERDHHGHIAGVQIQTKVVREVLVLIDEDLLTSKCVDR